MPRCVESIEAERLFRDEGLTIADIASRLNVPQSSVRRWKSTQKWTVDKASKKQSERSGSKASKKQSERSGSKKNKSTSQNKRGGQIGNKNPEGHRNAEGHGPPIGNKNSYKHGVYSNPFWNVLSDDEKAILIEMDPDEEQQLIDSITLYKARELRIMQAINRLRSMDDMIIDSVHKEERKREFDGPEDENTYNERQRKKVESGDILPGKPYNLTTEMVNRDKYLTRWEQELTSVQNKKDNAIEKLAKIRLLKREGDEEKKSGSVLSAWVSELRKMEGETDDG